MRAYTIKKKKNGQFALCKILNVYNKDEEEKALNDLFNLNSGEIKEEDLINEYENKFFKKEV